jgi:TPR repeat protein
MKKLLLILFLLTSQSNISNAQLSDITDVCGKNSIVNNGNSFFIISELCKAANVKNDFYLIPCSKISNCNAFVKENKKFIYYNPEFISQLRNFGLGLTVDDIKVKFTEWEAVASFAHEISHHLCGHLPLEKSKLSKQLMELQADEYAGYLMYKLSASLSQSQRLFYNSDFPIYKTDYYPARMDRLLAVKNGFESAQKQLIIVIQNSTIVYRKSGNPLLDENDKLAKEFYDKAVDYSNEEKYHDAFVYFTKSAALNYAKAFNGLGVCYSRGEGVKKNPAVAFNNYKKAADLGDSYGCNNLGICYTKGEGVTQNDEKGFFWFKKSAEQGNSGAQVNLGYSYGHGRGIIKDCVQAFIWYKKSADQGNDDAQHNLGNFYKSGECVTSDFIEAAEWFRKSAKQGNDNAQNNLGTLFKNGTGVEKNYDSAGYWYAKSALQHNVKAQYNLAILSMDVYENTCEEDFFNESLKYNNLLVTDNSQNNSGDIDHNLGSLYLTKFNCLLNASATDEELKAILKEAVSWYTKAANKGNAWGYEGLGDIYKERKNFKKAYQYYKKALELGSETAQNRIDYLRSIGYIK